MGDRLEGTWKGEELRWGLVIVVRVPGVGEGVRWGDRGDIEGDSMGGDPMVESYGEAASQSSEALLWLGGWGGRRRFLGLKCRGMKSGVDGTSEALWLLSSLTLLSKRAWSAELVDGKCVFVGGLLHLGRAVGLLRYRNLP